jgi:serine/threonine protein kinase
MVKWLAENGFSEEEMEQHPQLLANCASIVMGQNERIGPNCRLRKLPQSGKNRLEDYVKPGAVGEYYKDLHMIDSGSQGNVYRAVRIADGAAVAIKRVVIKNERTEIPALANEVALLSSCDHANVVRMYDCFRAGREVSIVMEMMDGGKLTDLLEEDPGIGALFTEPEMATIIREVLLGLEYLHHDGCMHRDIKSDNVLLNSSGDIKLGDFGFATSLNTAMRKTMVGTPYWMAPEIAKGDPYDYKADVWSVGILFLELCDGQPPMMGINPMRALVKIGTQPPPSIQGHRRNLTKQCYDFAAFLLVKDPKARPTAADALQHPFLSQHYTSTSFMKEYLALAKKNDAKKKPK